MTADLRLMLLGKPRLATVDGPAADFVYNKSLALLAFLARTSRPHSARRAVWVALARDARLARPGKPSQGPG